MKATEFELGWLIGILEGEGCFDWQTSNSARIRLTMTDEDTILRAVVILQKITGNECQVHVHTPKGRETRRKDYQQAYAIAVYGKNAIKVLKLIVRHMGMRRRRRIWQVINGHKEKPGQKIRLDTKTIVNAAILAFRRAG